MLIQFRRALALLAPVFAVAGLATASAQAAELRVNGERTVITASQQTGQFLATYHVTVTPTATASSGPDGSLILPTTHGTVSAVKMNGRIFHSGGVKFSHEGHSLVFRDFQLVRRHDRAVLTALVGDRRLVFARVDKFAVSIVGNEVIVTGQLRLGGETAAALNRLIGSNVATAGAEIGSLKSTIRIAT
jgi:hypothetical protein